MALNPYASLVDGHEPLAMIAATTGKLKAVVQAIGPAGLEKSPAPRKWAPREILCHLADTELAFGFRMRQAIAETNHVVQPFDQDAWAKPYTAIPAQAALDAFAALRAWNLAWLATVPPEAYSKPVSHPERGAMTFGTLVEIMAGHDVNHLRQLEALAARTK